MSGHDIWVCSVRKLDYVLLPWGSLYRSWSWTNEVWSLPINFIHDFNNGHCKCYNLRRHLHQHGSRVPSAIPFHSLQLQPIYLWILSSCLMTISFLFALTNWTVIIFAIIKSKTYCPSLFLRDGVYNKTIGKFRWFYSLIGLVIICLLLLLRLTLDKSQVGTFDLGWVSSEYWDWPTDFFLQRTGRKTLLIYSQLFLRFAWIYKNEFAFQFVIFTPCNIACWELLSLKVTIMCVSDQYRWWHRFQVIENGGITEKSSLLMNSK